MSSSLSVIVSNLGFLEATLPGDWSWTRFVMRPWTIQSGHAAFTAILGLFCWA